MNSINARSSELTRKTTLPKFPAPVLKEKTATKVERKNKILESIFTVHD